MPDTVAAKATHSWLKKHYGNRCAEADWILLGVDPDLTVDDVIDVWLMDDQIAIENTGRHTIPYSDPGLHAKIVKIIDEC